MTKAEAKRRAKELVAQMTVEEKISQLLYNSPAIERLGIQDYSWWNEASHGVARAGMATVFPHAIALAATFDPALVQEVADTVSTEARAKYNSFIARGDRRIYKGLTFWTPNINIFRDPRWGRGQETFGEDPCLTSLMGVAYVRGLQGDGEFCKSTACAKHYAVHSGPEKLRHTFNAVTDMHDLWETYLPAFEQTVKAGVVGVMGAYNRTNGEPCCAHEYLMQDVLMKQWGFDGYYVSDCSAIKDIAVNHHFTETMSEAAAIALRRGCHLNCGEAYEKLIDAYEEDLITEEEITAAAEKLFEVRHLLGEFEEKRPYADIPPSVVECAAHRALNLRAARESMVLLKNDGYLPADTNALRNIAVIGPNSLSVTALEGNYEGRSGEYITVADGVRRVFPDADIRVSEGCHLYKGDDSNARMPGCTNMIAESVAYAADADLSILVLGYDRTVEGEENSINIHPFSRGDRDLLGLPAIQNALAEAVCDSCKNVVVIVLAGSAVTLSEKVRAHAHAIIHGWYPGALGGLAAAELIAGRYSPAGKLPLTFYHSTEDLPDFCDYSMAGRTYRYFAGEPLYPFGYGLSYTTFRYERAKITSETDESYEITFTLRNTGERGGTEKVQIYASYTDSRTVTPKYQLCGVKAIELAPQEMRTESITVDKYWLKAVLSDGSRVHPNGAITLYVGGHQPDPRSCALCGNEPLRINVKE